MEKELKKALSIVRKQRKTSIKLLMQEMGIDYDKAFSLHLKIIDYYDNINPCHWNADASTGTYYFNDNMEKSCHDRFY